MPHRRDESAGSIIGRDHAADVGLCWVWGYLSCTAIARCPHWSGAAEGGVDGVAWAFAEIPPPPVSAQGPAGWQMTRVKGGKLCQIHHNDQLPWMGSVAGRDTLRGGRFGED